MVSGSAGTSQGVHHEGRQGGDVPGPDDEDEVPGPGALRDGFLPANRLGPN